MKAWMYIWMGSLVLLGSCEKEAGNHPPVIESILLDPELNFTPGSDINVTVSVRDQDQDELEFFWESEGGDILAPDQASSTWVLDTDAEPLSYESIRVTVSDGKTTVSETKTIQVTEGLLISGRTLYAGTSIPVPGVEISIGKFTCLSDDLGNYVIKHLKKGTSLVRASREGFDFFEEHINVVNPKSVVHIPMTSPTHTGSVSGIVKTNDGVLFGDLKVVLLNPDQTESDLIGYTDPQGGFFLENVPLGVRNLMIRSETLDSHFLNDSLIYQINMNDPESSYDARIKIKRTILSNIYLSENEKWEFDGQVSDGFYLIGKGQRLVLKDYIYVPADAERAMFYLDSYVVGGCDLVGKVPSHRVWISNVENEYMGGLSWGGEGSNFSANISWYPSEMPTYIGVYGKQLKFHMEVFEENNCVPNPLWRIYQLEFSYYY